MQKKIMLFSHVCCEDYITGAEKYILLLIKQLILQYGHHCVLIVPQEGVLSSEARSAGADIVVMSYPKTTAIWKPGPSSIEQLQAMNVDPHLNSIFNLIYSIHPDLIITNTCVNPMPAICAKRIGVPSAWIICEVIEGSPWTPDCIDFIDRNADWIIGISQTVLRPFLRYVTDRSKCVLLYPSWEMETLESTALWQTLAVQQRARMGLSADDKVVAYIAADIVPHKGLEYFVRMAVEVCRHYADAHFIIAGNPTDRAYYNQCIQWMEQSGYRRRFHLLPFQPNLQPIFSAMDILAVPSMVEEGFGMTALEGLYYGKAVIAFNSGGLGEIAAKTGNERWLCEKGDAAALAAKVLEVLSGGKPMMQSFNVNTQKVVQVFGIDQYQLQLDQYMQQVQQVWLDVARHRDQAALNFPDRVLIKGASTDVYLLENGYKRHIKDHHALSFYKFRWEQVIFVDDQRLYLYPTGREIRSDGLFQYNSPSSLLVKGSGSAIYLWESGMLSPFQSAEAFSRFDCHIHEVVHLPDSIIQALPKGAPITENAIMERGIINHRLYIAPSGERFYAEHGKLRKIENESVIVFFKWHARGYIQLSTEEFQVLQSGNPIAL